jgi:uncharacterized protein (DUF2249 family)
MHLENAGAGGCACGQHDDDDIVLDVRTVPHAIRHATVIGAFGAIPAGGSLVLVAPHNPLPLLNQLAELAEIEVVNLLDAPGEWRLRITRKG